jgi:hypothetical protein
MPIASLPYIDEHATVIAAGTPVSHRAHQQYSRCPDVRAR